MSTTNQSHTTVESNTAKNIGYILDERYVIKGILGSGGFSVVYDAVNLHNDQRVAIKECTVPEVKEKFLKEARMLRDFSDEPAIVSILDYFEDDDTAYIVMEYLAGRTLREHIESNAPLTMEESVRLLSPVMEVLTRMHDDGIIHRDISPDNLMILEDGSLKLLDFGAAKENSDKKVTKLIFKANYSPPELRDEEGIIGRWSDIYSMCATVYFCISGQDPEDVVSRLLLDELQPPSSLGVDILPPAEKLLLRGMEPKPGDRLQVMDELKSNLERYYPIISEEEKLAHAKAKKRRRLFAIAGIAIIVLCIAGYVSSHKLQVLFHVVDTETIFLDGSDFTDEEFKNSSRIVKKRVKAFSDGKFLWDEEGKKIRFEVPSELFGKSDPLQYTKVALSRPMKMYFSTYDKASDTYIPIEIIEQSKDIEAVDTSGSRTRITFTKNGQKKIGEELKAKDNPISFGLDISMDPHGSYNATTTGDGKTVILNSNGDSELPDELIKLHFLTDPFDFDKVFSVNRQWTIIWETPDTSMIPGKKQVDFKQLSSKSADRCTLCLRYKPISTKQTDDHGYDASHLSMHAIIRNRLDAFGIPYSIGKDPYEPDAIIVGLPRSFPCRELVTILGLETGNPLESGGKTHYYSSHFALGGKTTLTDLPGAIDSLAISEKGIELTTASDSDSEYKKKTSDILSTIKNQRQSHLYLYFMGIPVMRTSIDAAIDSFKNSSSISFDEWCCEKQSRKLIKSFAAFMSVSLAQAPEGEYEFFSSQVLDHKESMIDDDSKMPYLFKSEALAEEYVRQLRESAGDKMVIVRKATDDYRDSTRQLRIEFSYDKPPASTDTEAIETFCNLYKTYEKEFTNGTFTSILFLTFGGSTPLLQGKGIYKDNLPGGMISIDNDFDTGRQYIYYPYADSDPEMKKTIVNYLKNDPVFSKMITDESDIK